MDFCPYDDRRDFFRVRDFFSRTQYEHVLPPVWRIERWNYARWFVMPFLGGYRIANPTIADAQDAVRRWEGYNGIWERDGEITGIVTSEYPWPGKAFLLHRPGEDEALPAMLDYAERTLLDPAARLLTLYVYEHDTAQNDLARRRGYVRNDEYAEYDSVVTIEDLPPAPLPPGYAIRSMADDGSLPKRIEAMGRGFDHTDPTEWASEYSYESMQRAPDYHKDLDLYVVGPDGRYVSSCIVWYDALNRHAMLEPMCTHPDFRLRGFGRAVLTEGAHRAAALGATKIWVGSGQPFYQALGFRIQAAWRLWTK